MFNIFFNLGSSGGSKVSFLKNGEVVVSLEEGNFGGLSSNDEDVVKSGGEFKTILVFNVDDFIRSGMLF